MNIAFDMVPILGHARNRGMGYLTGQLVRHMILEDRKNHYFTFNCMEPYHLFENTPDNLTEEYFFLGKNLVLAEYQEVYGELLRSFLQKNKIDVFYVTGPFCVGTALTHPQGGALPAYRKAWFQDVKVVATVYDLIPMVFPEHYLRTRADEESFEMQVSQLDWVDMNLTISEAASDDLVKYMDIPRKKISCMWCSCKQGIGQIDIMEDDWAYMKESYGILPGFLMAPLAEDFRKNIDGLIRAYARLSKELRGMHQLVIVCNLSDGAVNRTRELAAEEGCEESLVLTGFVSDGEMNKLYNMARLMVFPSKYEGFGMPIVEAFACGTPVLTSNNSSCVQVAGDAAYLVDPFSVKDIARGLEEALADREAEQMVERGFRQLEKFQWDKVARDAVAAIDSLADIEVEGMSRIPLDTGAATSVVSDRLLRKLRRCIVREGYREEEIRSLAHTLAYLME